MGTVESIVPIVCAANGSQRKRRCAFPRRAIRSQIEPPCAGMLMPKLQTQVSPCLT